MRMIEFEMLNSAMKPNVYWIKLISFIHIYFYLASVLQQQEDEEMLVPHSDLVEGPQPLVEGPQPMEGASFCHNILNYCFPYLDGCMHLS